MFLADGANPNINTKTVARVRQLVKVYRLEGILLFLALVLLLVGCGSKSQATPQIGQHAYAQNGQLNYLLFLPQDYGKEKAEKWPLILFLHGIGERGDSLNDLDRLKVLGPPMIVEQQKDFPFIVVSPQCPTSSYWVERIDDLKMLLDQIVMEYSVDKSRIFLTGISLGGWGTWHFALQYPDLFAAIVPIAGFNELYNNEVPENICDLKNLPTWVFHGAQDKTVPIGRAEVMVEALRDCGRDVLFTIYPNAKHDSWTETYSNKDLYAWLLQQRNWKAVIKTNAWYIVGIFVIVSLVAIYLYLYKRGKGFQFR